MKMKIQHDIDDDDHDDDNDNDHDDDYGIVFVVWLTDEKRLVLLPVGIIVRDPHHRESPTRFK